MLMGPFFCTKTEKNPVFFLKRPSNVKSHMYKLTYLDKTYFITDFIFRYLKDHDNYQRMLVDQERQKRPKNLKRVRSNSGCLCFSSKSRKDMSFDN